MIRKVLGSLVSGKHKLYCSFCRKPAKELAELIGGPGIFTCDACVGLCNRILAGKATPDFGGWDSQPDNELLAALPGSSLAVDAAREALQMQADILRKRGVFWSAMADALGCSRQAAWERFSEFTR